jgi:hypothetical protein
MTSIGSVNITPGGLSAYQVAVNNGFVGSETDWLSSLGNQRIAENVVELRTISGFDNEVIDLLGYYVKGDKGGGSFFWDAVSTDADNGGTIIKATATTTGRWIRLIEDHVTPEMFGAKGDGIFNDTAAFQKCLGIGGTILLSGRYLLNHVSGTQSNYNIVGSDNAVLDFTQSDQNRTNCIDYGDFELKGNYTQISDLSVSPARFTKTINFSSSHNLEAGDLFVIWDPSDGSWNSMRDEYQAGEICEVANVVDSTEIEITDFLYDTYDSAIVEVHKLNAIKVKASNFKILGGGNPPPFLNFQSNYGFQVGGARDVVLENIQFEGAFRQTLHVAHAYNVSIKNISIDQIEEAPINNYGLMWSSTQNVWVTNCNINAIGDSIETSSGIPLQGSSISFPVRRSTVDSVSANTIISQHGHCEYGYISKCFSNGVVLGGDRSDVVNCYVSGNIQLAREGVGMNFTATGNTVKGGISATQCGDSECRYPSEIQKMKICNNTLEKTRISLPGVWDSSPATYEYHVHVENNRIENTNGSFTGAITTAGNGDCTAKVLVVKGNDINGTIDLRVSDSEESILFMENNNLREGARSSIIIHEGYVFVKNNTILDTTRNNGSPVQDTNLYISNAKKAYLIGNTFGDTVPNANGQWLAFGYMAGSDIYLQNNDALNQPNKEFYFNPAGIGVSEADIKSYFTGRANPNQGKTTIVSGTNSITVSELEISSDYFNVQLTGTHQEVSSCVVTNITGSSFDIEIGDGSNTTADRDIYWKLEA